MNNIALQKLIHLYQDPNLEYKLAFPAHWKAEYRVRMKTQKSLINENTGQIVEEVTPYFREISEITQKTTKFYIDMRDEPNSLTNEEIAKLFADMNLYSPYESFLIQIETADMVDHVHILNTYPDPDGELHDQIVATRFMYHKAKDLWSHDFNSYEFIRLPKKDNDPKEGFPFTIRFLSELDKEYVHIDERLTAWAQGIITAYALLNIHLQFPEISKQEDVKGRPNTTIGHHRLKKHTKSELRNLPSYEHKTLVLNMYDDDYGNGNGKRSSGTAFHSVRKHIMKIGRGKNKGKPTFRKAHFRGSKDVGVISKDYKIAGSAK